MNSTPDADPVATPRRARHLMDPTATTPGPGAPVAVEQTQRSLSKVQQWVMSVLTVSTIFHLAGGLVLAAVTMDNPRPGARLGLCLIAGAFGVLGVIAGRAIHRKPLLSWWLIAGLLPTVIGVWWIEIR